MSEVLSIGVLRSVWWDLPGGPVAKNPPANAGDMVQSLTWEESTCLWAAKLEYPQLLVCTLRSAHSGAHDLQQEKPPQ